MVTLLVCLVVVVGAVVAIVSMAMDDGTQPATRALSSHRDHLLQAGRARLAGRGREDLRRLSGFVAPVPARTDTPDAPGPADAATDEGTDGGDAVTPVFAPRPEPEPVEPITRPVPVVPPAAAGPGAVAVATRPPVPPPSPLKRTARLVRGTIVLILLLATLGAVLAAVLAGAAGLVAIGVRAAIG